MKKLFIVLCLLLVSSVLMSADNKQKIGELGDQAWQELIDTYRKNGKYADIDLSEKGVAVIAKNMVAQIDSFSGSLMRFPEIDFDNFITDRKNNRYYYYGVKNSNDLFVIKYDLEIGDKMRNLVTVFGASRGGYEVLGIVKEAYAWWGNVVLMDIKALRKPGQFCIIMKDGRAEMVAEDLIQRELDEKARDPYQGVPKNLTAVPKGLDPLTVAKLFYLLGSVEKKKDVWLQLISATRWWGGKPESIIENYWEMLSEKGRNYFFVREASDPNDPNSRKYFFQRQENGKNLSTPAPINLILEKGEWKVSTALP